jgi:hypothetical protein
MGIWVQQLAAHGNGIALVIARTDTRAFFESVWDKADAVLFLRGRLTFHHVSGKISDTGCTAPNVLVAYGAANVATLRECSDLGRFIELCSAPKIKEQLPDMRKIWRYPGVPIPERLKHRYKANPEAK